MGWIQYSVVIQWLLYILYYILYAGEFGVVYRASLLDEDNTTQTIVAVKTIKGI